MTKIPLKNDTYLFSRKNFQVYHGYPNN